MIIASSYFFMMTPYYFLFLTIIIFYCVVQNSSYSFTTKYAELPMDQFGFTYNGTFKLRYLVNDSFFNNNSGCIFFYTGSEGEVTLDSQSSGFLFDIAPTFNALIVFAEHRYYGESLPYGNYSLSSPAYAQFLSTEQALADFVDVISELQRTYSNRDLPVIAFGGSYGGALASWLRMKYPHVVVGALASSAPIWQFAGITPCENFNKHITDIYSKQGTTACSDGIKKSWGELRKLTEDDAGKTKLSNLWKLCKPLETSQDIESFFQWLYYLYANMAILNYPYPNNFYTPLPANPVKRFCNRLVNGQNDDFLKALEYATKIYSNFSENILCNDVADADHCQLLLPWNFQSCSEIIIPFCSTDQDMFWNYDWNYETYAKKCIETTGMGPKSPNFIAKEYGGKRIEAASNIIFSNGLLDPWSQGGVLRNISSTVIAWVIAESAHQQDLKAANPNDPESVVAARKFYIQQFKLWIDEFDKIRP